MNEEEKKAIEYLINKVEIWKKQRPEYGNSDIVYEIDDENKQIQTALNLITKQQEEIKELKLITNTYNSYEGKDMDHTKIIIADSNYFINGTFVEKFVSKDKIREKIKELKECRMRAISDIGLQIFNAEISMLEQLLED